MLYPSNLPTRSRIADRISVARCDRAKLRRSAIYQQPDLPPEFNLRGVFRTDEDGHCRFSAVMPKFDPIPDDATVGKLWRAPGRAPYRSAHLQFTIKANGYETLRVSSRMLSLA